ncbi:MAG TPA: hypothetical protein VNW30_05960 [Opitutaceae bacterium]|jgi:hypothetical protein|nr:hypothetical protein [Opitutaceae bacterium]
MLTSKRDYILRIIDEVGELLSRVIFQRSKNRPEDAMQSVVQAGERLFNLEADKLFQFTPEQQFAMLTEHESPEIAGQKVLLFAALNAEAGKIYAALGDPRMSRSCFINALRFTLKARAGFPVENPPACAPRVPDLLAALKDAPLDADTAALLGAERPTPKPDSEV